MTRTTSFLLGAALASVGLASVALADRYRLADGSSFEAETIGEAGEVLVLFDHEGRTLRVAKAGVASVESGSALPEKLAPKFARARRSFRSARRREAKRLLKRYGRAKEKERQKILQKLEGFSPRLLEAPLTEALEDKRVRAFALERLKQTGGPSGLRPLVRAAITSKDKKLRAQAHETAVATDRLLTRTYYEEIVSLPTSSKRRMRALKNLAGMGDRAAIPGLIYALEKVETEIKTALATAGGLRRVPVNLGSQGGAAVNAPIELPEQNLTAVATKVSVSSLRQVASGVRKVLGGLSGVDRPNAKAWKTWWDEQPTTYRK